MNKGETESEFDAVLRRMLTMKPLSKAEISARIKAEREAKNAKKAKTVQKMDK